MLLAFVTLLSLAAPVNPPPITGGCFGPCYVPGCNLSTFWICHETSGKTKIYAENGGQKSTTTRDNDTSDGASAHGAIVQPGPGKTWGTVSQCSEVTCWC